MQILVTGHSLGGNLTEYAAADPLFGGSQSNAYFVTFGSPRAEPQALSKRLVNFVHTDDIVAALESSLLQREGTDIVIVRPEGTFNGYVEHSAFLYRDSVAELVKKHAPLSTSGTDIIQYFIENGGRYRSGDASETVVFWIKLPIFSTFPQIYSLMPPYRLLLREIMW